MRKSFEDPFAILNTLAGGVLLKITHVNLIQFEHIGVEKKEQQIQSLLNFPCSKMFQSMVATSQGVSIKQQINWAEVLVGWDQPEKCFWLNLTNLKFEAMEVTVSCRICILLHILIYIYT